VISIPIVEALPIQSNLRNTFDGHPLLGSARLEARFGWWIDKKEKLKRKFMGKT